MRYEDEYRRSIEQPEAFWAEQARAIHWHTPPRTILEYTNPPFRKWFAGGETNLCYNAVDRHLDERGDQTALIAISTETNASRQISYRELYREVNTFAAVLASLGVSRGERVVIYMPNMAEAVFAMLACARLGAIHSVVFGGFAAHNLALRIDDAKPRLLICADAGSRAGKVIAYKPMIDEALREAAFPPGQVLFVSRGLDQTFKPLPGRDVDYAEARRPYETAEVPVEWLESNEPSYLLYTSGTTGKPKGVQRDVGRLCRGDGAVDAQRVRCGGRAGDVLDVRRGLGGWPQLQRLWPADRRATALLYEGLAINPDPGIWWQLCEKYGVRTMFSSPTAIRMLKKQDPAWLKKYDLSQLKYLFLAGEPLDEPTAKWITEAIGKPVIDNYWQTETGWPAITLLPAWT